MNQFIWVLLYMSLVFFFNFSGKKSNKNLLLQSLGLRDVRRTEITEHLEWSLKPVTFISVKEAPWPLNPQWGSAHSRSAFQEASLTHWCQYAVFLGSSTDEEELAGERRCRAAVTAGDGEHWPVDADVHTSPNTRCFVMLYRSLVALEIRPGLQITSTGSCSQSQTGWTGILDQHQSRLANTVITV